MDPVESIIKNILAVAGIPFTNVVRDELAGQAIYRIETDDASRLIGSRGDTIHALDLLIKKIVEKSGIENPLFLVDANDYRTRQIKELQQKALMMAERARSFQYDVELTPMTAYERLIIHTTLADLPDIKTESHGEGRNRRVVIRYVTV